MSHQTFSLENFPPARLLNETRRFFIITLLATLLPTAPSASAATPIPSTTPTTPTITLSQNKGEHSFRVIQLPAKQLAKFKAAKPAAQAFARAFRIFATDKPTEDFPAMSGAYRLAKNALIFTPRYPLQPGLTYTAVFKLNAKTLTKSFNIPKPKAGPPARVTALYPSNDTLPENLLRFYIHFSNPMSRGQAYQRIALFDHNTGQNVDRPFLELEEELWDPAAKRFTLLFDPGRVKEGLTPRLEVGPSLNRNHQYTLRIDAGWLDAQSNPMAKTFERSFTVTNPDTTQPDINNWKLTPPHASSVAPLTVRFPEPLDHSMLHRVLTVKDKSGRPIPGAITVDEHETRWRFTPDKPWLPGAHQLVVATILEDRAANSLGRPFEVDMNNRKHAKLGEFVTLKFNVSAAAPN